MQIDSEPSSTPAQVIEDVVGDIWREVLGFDLIEREADFIDLGGDSISAVQIVDQVRRRLGIRLAAETVLDHPTLARFTALIGSQSRGR
jgi:phthiocerol/phenolphthiocerol synthesis type-I polyketide synthase E